MSVGRSAGRPAASTSRAKKESLLQRRLTRHKIKNDHCLLGGRYNRIIIIVMIIIIAIIIIILVVVAVV